jgi:hypothetical protein
MKIGFMPTLGRDAIVDFAGQAEPVTFERDYLLNGEWTGPLQPPA